MDSGVYKFRKRRPKAGEEWHQSQIDPMILLEQVKMYPFIYNKDHANYRDKILKSSVWYRICKNMFPEFESYSAATKLRMHYEIRQRWMGLRVAIMREAKHIIETGSSRTTVREGVRPLEFLMAYINNKNCQKLAKAWGLSRLPNDDIIPNDIKHLLERKKTAKTANITEDEDSDLLNDEDGLYDDEDDVNSDQNTCEIKTSRLSPNTSASIESAITPPINFKLQRNSKQHSNRKPLKRTKNTNDAEQTLPDSADETEAIQLPPKSFVKMQSDRLGGYGEQINSNHLLEIIKKYPFVFNPFHPKFREKTLRKKGWERICAVMFPEYPNCSQESKFEIGFKLRRRWTSLRAKTSGEAKDCLKTGKPLRPELLFLLPYIKSPQSEELTKKLGIKRLPNDDIVPDDIEVSKEGEDNEDNNYDDTLDGDDDDEFLPKIHTDIDEFLKMSSRTGVNNTEQSHKSKQATCSSQNLRKRQHTDTETETQRQLSEYLAKFKKRLLRQDFDVGKDENDKDRLFLLSLTDDFKQIPAHKKIYVKAKIATVLIHAMEN